MIGIGIGNSNKIPKSIILHITKLTAILENTVVREILPNNNKFIGKIAICTQIEMHIISIIAILNFVNIDFFSFFLATNLLKLGYNTKIPKCCTI